MIPYQFLYTKGFIKQRTLTGGIFVKKWNHLKYEFYFISLFLPKLSYIELHKLNIDRKIR